MTSTHPEDPGATKTIIMVLAIAAAAVIGLSIGFVVRPPLPPILWLIPVAGLGLYAASKHSTGREWRTMHNTVLNGVAAAGHDQGMRWSAPCQWLATPGDPSDDDRAPFNGVIAVFDEGIAWFPAPLDDGDIAHPRQKPWTVPASNVALVHRSRSGVGDGFDIHGRDQSVRCLQIPPGFLGDAIAVVNSIGYRLLDD